MNQDLVLDIARHALIIIMMIAAPPLLASLVTGLMVSLFQAMTQINEATLSFIPKIVVVGLVLIFGGHWMLTTLMNYTISLIDSIPQLIGIR